jgi:phosphate transport system substrate-binding protein
VGDPVQSDNAIAGGASGTAAWSFLSGQAQQSVLQPETPETATFELDATAANSFVAGETASTPDLGEGHLDLTPRNSRWAYAAWDIPRSVRSRIEMNAGDHLVLRLYDVTDGGFKLPSRYEQHDIDEMALSCDVPISQPDRTYVAEIGYIDPNYQWTPLARSAPASIPAS